MTYQHKEGSGALFRNRKENDRQPDWRGDAMFKGELVEVAGWEKEGTKGPFISLSLKSKADIAERGSQRMERQPDRQSFADDMDDTVPF